VKKLFFFVLVVVVGSSYYVKHKESINFTLSSSKNINVVSNQGHVNNYQCDGRQYCSQMRSYEEAKFFIDNCPNTKMDGDNDGIPCERQF
jgi:hypothetical protein